jgi:hypothetical protein
MIYGSNVHNEFEEALQIPFKYGVVCRLGREDAQT